MVSIAPTHVPKDLIQPCQWIKPRHSCYGGEPRGGRRRRFYAVALDIPHRELSEGRRNAATEIAKPLSWARGETVELQTVEDEDLGVDIDSDLAVHFKFRDLMQILTNSPFLGTH